MNDEQTEQEIQKTEIILTDEDIKQMQLEFNLASARLKIEQNKCLEAENRIKNIINTNKFGKYSSKYIEDINEIIDRNEQFHKLNDGCINLIERVFRTYKHSKKTKVVLYESELKPPSTRSVALATSYKGFLYKSYWRKTFVACSLSEFKKLIEKEESREVLVNNLASRKELSQTFKDGIVNMIEFLKQVDEITSEKIILTEVVVAVNNNNYDRMHIIESITFDGNELLLKPVDSNQTIRITLSSYGYGSKSLDSLINRNFIMTNKKLMLTEIDARHKKLTELSDKIKTTFAKQLTMVAL
jgi:hypothetical protein